MKWSKRYSGAEYIWENLDEQRLGVAPNHTSNYYLVEYSFTLYIQPTKICYKTTIKKKTTTKDVR